MRALALPLRHLPAAFCAGINRFWFCHAYLFIWRARRNKWTPDYDSPDLKSQM
jgi:hypothetical protein